MASNLQKHEKTIRSLLDRTRSSYRLLTAAAEVEEKAKAYRECDELLEQLSSFEYGKARDLLLSPDPSCEELVENINLLEKTLEDLRLKIKLRMTMIGNDLMNVQISGDNYFAIKMHQKTVRSLLERARSNYRLLTAAAEVEEKAKIYRECDELLEQLSSFEHGKARDMLLSPDPSCEELVENINLLEKTLEDLRLKIKLRMTMIGNDLMKIEHARKVRLEDMKEEFKIKMGHLQFLEKDLSRIYNGIGNLGEREELNAIHSNLNEIMQLLQVSDSEDNQSEDSKILRRERGTLLTLARFIDSRIEAKITLLRDIELLGAEKVADRVRPKLQQIQQETQEITNNLRQAPQDQLPADYLKRAEWLLEGIEINDYMKPPQLYIQLKDVLDSISFQINQIRTFLSLNDP
ncbi:MAG: hypothetical protein ACE5OZ_12965 [Candidatus Heimdallarchaeota archaeon]